MSVMIPADYYEEIEELTYQRKFSSKSEIVRRALELYFSSERFKEDVSKNLFKRSKYPKSIEAVIRQLREPKTKKELYATIQYSKSAIDQAIRFLLKAKAVKKVGKVKDLISGKHLDVWSLTDFGRSEYEKNVKN